jgi:hypothetical protein
MRPTRLSHPVPMDPLASMRVEEPGRSAEAVRRVFAELLRLNRFAIRAASRRDRALSKVFRKPFCQVTAHRGPVDVNGLHCFHAPAMRPFTIGF